MATLNVGITSAWKKIAKADADNFLVTVTARGGNVEFATTENDTAPVESIDGHTLGKQETHTFILSDGERLWRRAAGNKAVNKLAVTPSGSGSTFADA